MLHNHHYDLSLEHSIILKNTPVPIGSHFSSPPLTLALGNQLIYFLYLQICNTNFIFNVPPANHPGKHFSATHHF